MHTVSRSTRFGASLVAALFASSGVAEAAARSVDVTLTNSSDTAITLTAQDLPHGCWDSHPPSSIAPGASAEWKTESCGFATGTEGTADFTFANGGTAHIHWDDPFVGTDKYDEAVNNVGYHAVHTNSGGNDANVTFTFDCSSSTCDGIPDDWKLNGTTIDPGDGSGPQFINLPAMGATVNKPDIFVQLDWMANPSATPPTNRQLSDSAIQAVVTAFANSPYKSRTGSTGINLHVDAGSNSTLNAAAGTTWGSLSKAQQQTEVANFGTCQGGANNYSWTAFDNVKTAKGGFISTGRSKIFRYAISVNQICNVNNSGITRAIPGSDFIISLGTFGSPPPNQQESGTFMHELGHALGLQHGGGDSTNFKPNYFSVMNYLFQLSGLTKNGTSGVLDYSQSAQPTLNENNLSEPAGIGSSAAPFQTSHWCASAGAKGSFVSVAGGGAIDWNCDGDTTDTGVVADINNDSSDTNLTGYNDWANISLQGGSVGGSGDWKPPMVSQIDEITPEIARKILPVDTRPPVTTYAQSPAADAAGWNRTPVSITFSATDDISGVARTEAEVDGSGLVPAPKPLVVSTEGIHDIGYRSKDYSQNVEKELHHTLKIDRTSPEAVIVFDPTNNTIVVTGRDALSGVDPKPIAPSSTTPTTWTDFGSDVAELRSYRIEDLAGNVLTLKLKVRIEIEATEFSVVELDYGAPQSSNTVLPKNTVRYRILKARGENLPIFEVQQDFAIGEKSSRATTHEFYSPLQNYSHFLTSPPAGLQEFDTPGLVLVKLVSDRGNLRLEH